MALTQIHDDVWVQSAELTMLGLHLGTRMTVVRLPSGGLWVHSPIALDEETTAQLRELGPVEHIVAPNLYHHLHVGPAQATFEGSIVHARPKLRKKRKDLHIDADLTNEAPDAWGGVFEPVEIGGNMLDEVVFHHRPSNSLIACDLVENFTQCSHWLTRMYLKTGGIFEQPGVSRYLRIMFRDRAKVRASVDHLASLKFDGIVLAHGDVIEEGGTQILLDSYQWL